MALTVTYFEPSMEAQWDQFVLNGSMNGTFLQTRRFLNYHPEERFLDRSLCVFKGNELVATVPACELEDGGKRTFFAHKGSTFGGITVSKKIYSASAISELMEQLHSFLEAEGYEKVYLKMVPDAYQKENANLLEYFLYQQGYTCYNELNYYMHLDRYREDALAQFSSSKRRDYRYALKNPFTFRLLQTREEVADFYRVLQLNLQKLGLKAVHTLEDLYDLKYERFPEQIRFYGVYLDDTLVAGSMIFIFDGRIFHTQYLSSDEQYLKLFPMDFLIGNLIRTAAEENMEMFSFGICTEDQGRYLNLGLSRFKEGFGTEFCINRSYERLLK